MQTQRQQQDQFQYNRVYKMAGFGSISLTQTAIGTLLDQRAVVLYKQPADEIIDSSTEKGIKSIANTIVKNLVGNAFKYEELFAGLLSGADIDFGALTQIANVTGTNPYGITYIDAKVSIESDLCDHPVETGIVVTDASILLPISAEVTVAMPTYFAERIYEQMKDMYRLKKDKIILQTKYGLYRNLVLQNIEYELEHDTVDRTKFVLTLREIQEGYVNDSAGEVAAEKDKIAKASDATTVNTGSQMAVGA